MWIGVIVEKLKKIYIYIKVLIDLTQWKLGWQQTKWGLSTSFVDYSHTQYEFIHLLYLLLQQNTCWMSLSRWTADTQTQGAHVSFTEKDLKELCILKHKVKTKSWPKGIAFTCNCSDVSCVLQSWWIERISNRDSLSFGPSSPISDECCRGLSEIPNREFPWGHIWPQSSWERMSVIFQDKSLGSAAIHSSTYKKIFKA